MEAMDNIVLEQNRDHFAATSAVRAAEHDPPHVLNHISKKLNVSSQCVLARTGPAPRIEQKSIKPTASRTRTLRNLASTNVSLQSRMDIGIRSSVNVLADRENSALINVLAQSRMDIELGAWSDVSADREELSSYQCFGSTQELGA